MINTESEISGEVENDLYVKKSGATKAFYDDKGRKISNNYHSIERIDENRFLGEIGANRHILSLEDGRIEEVTPKAHNIEDTGSGYIIKRGASTKRFDYDGNPSRTRFKSGIIGQATRTKTSSVQEDDSGVDELLENKSPEPELEGVNKVLSGVEEHNSKKQESSLYSLRVKAGSLTGRGKQISLHGDTSSRVDTKKFEEFFSPLMREHSSEVDYGGSMPEEAHQHLLEDIIEKNETRIESCIGVGEERQPEIVAYDTGDGILYEGLVHLLIDTQEPLGEEPFDLVGNSNEEEFEVRVKVPYEESTEIPQSNVNAQQAEEQIFEKEVSYN